MRLCIESFKSNNENMKDVYTDISNSSAPACDYLDYVILLFPVVV